MKRLHRTKDKTHDDCALRTLAKLAEKIGFQRRSLCAKANAGSMHEASAADPGKAS